jgi:outer membrane protein assembly factor BamB
MADPTATPKTGWRRWRYPLVLVAIAGIMAIVPSVYTWAYEALTADTVGGLMPVTIGSQLVFLLCGLLLLLWWSFGSGFTWRTRGLGVLTLVLAFGGFVLSVRKFEFGMAGQALAPRFTFVWEPSADAVLASHRAQHVATSNLNLTVAESDFPRYRGANGDGQVRGLRLASDWSATPAQVRWQQPIGGGYAGFAVAGSVAITAEQRGPREAVVCYDRATGKQHWEYLYDAYHQDVMGDGPRATPTIANGRVYSLGALGDLVCLDGQTGKRIWSVNILTDSAAQKVLWGQTGSPLVVDDWVVVQAGVNPDAPAGRSLVAYHQADGKRGWAVGQRKASYSSPLLATVAGVRQIVMFDADGLTGHAISDGAELWHHDWRTFSDMNTIQPVPVGNDRFFIASEADNGGMMVQVSYTEGKWATREVWKNRHLCAKFANPVAIDGHLYGLSTGRLVCVNAETGAKMWKEGNFGMGQVLAVGAHLLIVSDQGDVCLVAADPKQFRALARLRVFNDKTWNTPAIAGKELFVRNQAHMACLELPIAE